MNKKLDLILYIFFMAAICALFASCKKEYLAPAEIKVTTALQFPGTHGTGFVSLKGTLPNITDSVVIYEGASKVFVQRNVKNEVLSSLIPFNRRKLTYDFTLIAYPSGISLHYTFKP